MASEHDQVHDPLSSGQSVSDSDDVEKLTEANPEIVKPNEVEHLSVKCGQAEGEFYLSKFISLGCKGCSKCVLSGSKWFTPVEFETLEGKPKSKHWKRSILHKDSPISSFLPQSGRSDSRSRSSSPFSLESNIADVTSGIVNTLLAFIKAYRLMGDTAGLKSAVLSRFTVESILTSYKLPLVWDSCSDHLHLCGLAFRTRRGTEKQSLGELVLVSCLL